MRAPLEDLRASLGEIIAGPAGTQVLNLLDEPCMTLAWLAPLLDFVETATTTPPPPAPNPLIGPNMPAEIAAQLEAAISPGCIRPNACAGHAFKYMVSGAPSRSAGAIDGCGIGGKGQLVKGKAFFFEKRSKKLLSV